MIALAEIYMGQPEGCPSRAEQGATGGNYNHRAQLLIDLQSSRKSVWVYVFNAFTLAKVFNEICMRKTFKVFFPVFSIYFFLKPFSVRPTRLTVAYCGLRFRNFKYK